jgi:transcriptional regulator with XRE-family HTH domain
MLYINPCKNKRPRRGGGKEVIAVGNHRKIDFTFGQRLEKLMIERQLYPGTVQKLTGVPRQYIYDYVQGIRQPTALNIRKIAEGLKVSADWLLGIMPESYIHDRE